LLVKAGHSRQNGGKHLSDPQRKCGEHMGRGLYIAVHSNAGGAVTEPKGSSTTGSVKGKNLCQHSLRAGRASVERSRPWNQVGTPRSSNCGFRKLPPRSSKFAFHDNAEGKRPKSRKSLTSSLATIAVGICEVAGGVVPPPVPVIPAATDPGPRPRTRNCGKQFADADIHRFCGKG